jgi:hypothetical protein
MIFKSIIKVVEMSKYTIEPMLPKKLKTVSLDSRESKVVVKDFAECCPAEASLNYFINSLPDILAGRDFKDFLVLMHKAKEHSKNIIFSMGAHVIKVGLNPIVIDLLKKGWISALALNGAGIIHDFEIAFAGKTSEEVGSQIQEGDFGMANETGRMLNEAINAGADADIGLGEAVGKMIYESDFPFKQMSLTAAAFKLNIPVTVHVAMGTDIVHYHPGVKGESIGKTSLRDFFLFCKIVKYLDGGGIYINAGSAVILPEVFLKAVTYVRNQGIVLKDFSTAVFDFIHHYRPYQNVVKRPLIGDSRGFYFIGHHEIMIPLLAAALISE